MAVLILQEGWIVRAERRVPTRQLHMSQGVDSTSRIITLHLRGALESKVTPGERLRTMT